MIECAAAVSETFFSWNSKYDLVEVVVDSPNLSLSLSCFLKTETSDARRENGRGGVLT